MPPSRESITHLDQKPGTVETRASQASQIVEGAKELELLRIQLETQALLEIARDFRNGVPISGTRIG